MIEATNPVQVTVAGAIIALLIAATIGSTLYWMLHPAPSYVERIAERAESDLERMVGRTR